MKAKSLAFMVCVCILILHVMLTISGAWADYDPLAASYITYDTTYEKILSMYLREINAYGYNTGRHDLFNSSIFYSAGSPEDGEKALISATKRAVGYLLYDLNQDGIDELLIGTDGGWLHEVFTMDGAEVRELLKAGAFGTASSVYSCAMLDNGMLFRHAHDGPVDFYELWSMEGSGPLSFEEGYCVDYETGANETGDPDTGAWFRMNRSFRGYKPESSDRVKDSVGEAWLRRQNNAVWRKKFVPFSIFEKYPDDPWNIAVLSVNGSTSSSAKVHIRKEADDRSRLVATKNAGTYVKVLSRAGSYFQIAMENKEGYIRQEYLTPVTYRISLHDDIGTDGSAEEAAGEGNGNAGNQPASPVQQEGYPVNGTTNRNSVNIREERKKNSRLIAAIQNKGSLLTVNGEFPDGDGVVWYLVEYKGKEGFVRNDFIDLKEPGSADSPSNEELYGLVIKKLATRSGPSPRSEDTGTYSVKGQRIRVYTRAYDPIENAWWVKCDVPYHGEIRTLWAWYTRFDSKTLPLESIPIDEEY